MIRALFALVAVVILGAQGPLRSEDVLLETPYDDAYYYFQIARNVALGHGSTFDGLHATNGYHPLWMAILVPFFRLAPGPELAIRAVGLLQIALTVAALDLFFRTLRARSGNGVAAGATLALFATPGTAGSLVGGMETSLFLLVLVMTWRRWLALDAKAVPGDWARLGGWCAVAVLARFESVVLVPVVLTLAWRWNGTRPSARHLVAFLAPVAVCVVALTAWYRLRFGLWVPVSGLVKVGWTRRWPAGWYLRSLAELPWLGQTLVMRVTGGAATDILVITLHLALLGGLAILGWRYREPLRARLGETGVGFLVLGALALLLALKLTIVELWGWERVSLIVMPAALAAAAWPRLRLQRTVLAAALLLAILPAARTAWLLRDPDYRRWREWRQVGLWMAEHIPADQRVGSWNGGRFALFSGRTVINLDGLTNDSAFFKTVIQQGRLADYLDDQRVDWLVDCGPGPAPPAPVDRERLARTFAEVAAFASPNGMCPRLGVWRRI